VGLVLGYILFKMVVLTVGLRVAEEESKEELEGLSFPSAVPKLIWSLCWLSVLVDSVSMDSN
jgi:hypothetical protein